MAKKRNTKTDLQVIDLENVPVEDRADVIDRFCTGKFMSLRDFVTEPTQTEVYRHRGVYFLTGDNEEIILFDGTVFTDISNNDRFDPDPSPKAWQYFLYDVIEMIKYAGMARGSRPTIWDGVVLNNKILLNGDLFNKVVESCAGTFSFICLQTILGLRSLDQLIKQIKQGKIKLLDVEPDTIKKLTTAEVKKTQQCNFHMTRLTPPSPGFVLVGRKGSFKWHRSGACLFACDNKRYLLGVDEESYFGSLLAGKPNTLTEARRDLMPKEVHGKPHVRQGEWFSIPAIPPTLAKTIAFSEFLALPVDDPDSNKHVLVGYPDSYDPNHTENIRVDENGQIYASKACCMKHVDHEDLRWNWEWAKLVRNTAIRSVSVDGVD